MLFLFEEKLFKGVKDIVLNEMEVMKNYQKIIGIKRLKIMYLPNKRHMIPVVSYLISRGFCTVVRTLERFYSGAFVRKKNGLSSFSNIPRTG